MIAPLPLDAILNSWTGLLVVVIQKSYFLFSAFVDHFFSNWCNISSNIFEDSTNLPYCSLLLLPVNRTHKRQSIPDEDKLPRQLTIAVCAWCVCLVVAAMSCYVYPCDPDNIATSLSTMMNFPIVSWNISGMHSPLKRTMIFMCQIRKASKGDNSAPP